MIGFNINRGEWLEWGTDTNIVKRGLSVTISGMKGKYYGEWLQIGDLILPYGRGALDCEDKLILGHVKDGEWADGSNQIIVDKLVSEFRVHRLVRARPSGTQF